MPAIESTNKYQINAFVAFAIGLVGFLVCSSVGALASIIVPHQLAVGIGAALIIAFLGGMKSRTQITSGSEHALRTVMIIISLIAIAVVLALFAYNYQNFLPVNKR
ncbi:MAG TPA: hypothetical protein VN956_27325 [Pyrinomonadaceae bacterium]|nr:hypothetical protein [Pyrinomonadaceae bacterium]